MLSNECYLALHDRCSEFEHCECLCHVEHEPMFDDLMRFLMEQEEET